MSKNPTTTDSVRANVLGNEINKYVRLMHPEYREIDYLTGMAFALAMATAEGKFNPDDVAAMVSKLVKCQAVKIDTDQPLDEAGTKAELAKRGVHL